MSVILSASDPVPRHEDLKNDNFLLLHNYLLYNEQTLLLNYKLCFKCLLDNNFNEKEFQIDYFGAHKDTKKEKWHD